MKRNQLVFDDVTPFAGYVTLTHWLKQSRLTLWFYYEQRITFADSLMIFDLDHCSSISFVYFVGFWFFFFRFAAWVEERQAKTHTHTDVALPNIFHTWVSNQKFQFLFVYTLILRFYVAPCFKLNQKEQKSEISYK